MDRYGARRRDLEAKVETLQATVDDNRATIVSLRREVEQLQGGLCSDCAANREHSEVGPDHVV